MRKSRPAQANAPDFRWEPDARACLYMHQYSRTRRLSLTYAGTHCCEYNYVTKVTQDVTEANCRRQRLSKTQVEFKQKTMLRYTSLRAIHSKGGKESNIIITSLRFRQALARASQAHQVFHTSSAPLTFNPPCFLHYTWNPCNHCLQVRRRKPIPCSIFVDVIRNTRWPGHPRAELEGIGFPHMLRFF